MKQFKKKLLKICKNDSGANDTTHVENLFKKKESFYLFPNPTSDLLNMVFFNSEVPFEISVTSILGNVLYQGVYANNQSINISNCSILKYVFFELIFIPIA